MMARASALAWRSLTNAPTVLNISLVDHFEDDAGEAVPRPGLYNIAVGDVRIALESITDYRQAFPAEARLVLYAAHETTHKYQHHREGKRFVPDKDLYSAGYYTRPREVEAWRVALNVFKFLYPLAHGTLVCGELELPVRENSTITDTLPKMRY